MLSLGLQYRVDAAVFIIVALIGAALMQRKLRRTHRAPGLPRRSWLVLGLILLCGTALAEVNGRLERRRLQRMLEGYAPTYADEMARLGHSRLPADCPPDDPTYLTLVGAQVHWLRMNPSIADIYTIRRHPDGTHYLMVDSETDYDGNGRIEGETEARTPIGEIIETDYDLVEAAFAGKPTFADVPIRDRWGVWVSAYAPMYNAAGEVEAVLGVDYDADQWLASIAWSRLSTLGFFGMFVLLQVTSSGVMQLTRSELEQRRRAEQAARASEARLRIEAMEDKLTGLPNRRMLTQHLARALARASAHPDHHAAVLFLDFDRFKIINDSLGHEIGDMLLIGIAQRLRSGLEQDSAPGLKIAARLGGDEFIVLLDGIHRAGDAAAVATRLMQALSRPYSLSDHEVHVTASIGITTTHVGYHSPEAMLRDADTAMYRAKAAGKGRYILFDQRMHEEAMERLTMENELRHAIERGELMLLYQPIVSLETGRTDGFEAVVRWRRSNGVIVERQEFLPLAEEVGQIVPIGLWVLRTACQQLARWQREPDLADVTLSVPLPHRQLATPDLVSQVRRMIEETGANPERLKLQVAESTMMEDPDLWQAVFEELRALGMALHMVDFGTGYSSLNCLHRFPIDGVKIDRGFINNVGDRRDYAAVVNAIISLAHNLNISLVAEGVETADQVAMLQALGCDQGQGAFFGLPLAPDAALTVYRRRAQAA